MAQAFDILDHDLVFAIGGFDGREAKDTIEVYDLDRGSWEAGPRMLAPRRGFGVAVVDADVFVVGGYTEREGILDRVERLNLTFGDWRQAPPMPTRRCGLAVAAIGGRLFAVGGRGGGRVLDAVEVYDPDEQRWSAWPSLPKARTSLGLAAWQGRLYAVGGDVGGGGPVLGGAIGGAQPVNLLDILDTKSTCWEQGAPMHTRRCDLGVAATYHRVFAIGGFGGRVESGDYLSSVEIYDINAGHWEAGQPMMLARAGVGVAVYHSRILVFGGPFAGVGTTTMEILDAEAAPDEEGAWCQGPPMPTQRFGVVAAIHLGAAKKVKRQDESARVRARVAMTRALSRALVEAGGSSVSEDIFAALSQAIQQCQAAGLDERELEAAHAAQDTLRRKLQASLLVARSAFAFLHEGKSQDSLRSSRQPTREGGAR